MHRTAFALLCALVVPAVLLTAVEPVSVDRDWTERGLAWLLAAQHPQGGWGAGSHAQQAIRDPHAVQTDPATTAFVCLALMRVGNTLDEGPQHQALARAVDHLLAVVEAAPSQGPRITELQGTQIQAKLGPLIDTAMTAQALARLVGEVAADDPRRQRIDRALAVCLAKLEGAQTEQGHWGGGGWAPILQAATATTALEMAVANGAPVDETKLKRARDFQQASGTSGATAAGVPGATGDDRAAPAAFMAIGAGGGMSAGVELYGFAGGQRAGAARSRAAQEAVAEALAKGRIEDEAVTVENLTVALDGDVEQAEVLARSYATSKAQAARVVNDERLLDGFGNNGGEEYFSYLMSTESLLITGGEEYETWMQRMRERLPQAQNPDGSWSGHHCITSPVFCTAAVIQIPTAANDRELLARLAATGDEATD